MSFTRSPRAALSASSAGCVRCAASRAPALYFKHLLLPHAPWTYLPSGRRYLKGPSERVLSWDLWHYNRWLVNQVYQRHLLQVEFTDRLLGRALARLRKTGLYDRSLIVLTADNGESFGRVGNGHNFNHRNAAEIALTPLIVKLPFQRAGRIDRRHVRVIDVLPTIASVAHVRPGWRVDGVPLVGSHRRRPPASALLFERDGRRIVLSGRELRRRAAAALRLKLRLFGSGDAGPGLYGTRTLRCTELRSPAGPCCRRTARVRCSTGRLTTATSGSTRGCYRSR
jgi:hypothetical protein